MIKCVKRYKKQIERGIKMLKSFKTEINSTVGQKAKINKTIGVCRYIYNFYLGHNKALHDKGEKFMTKDSNLSEFYASNCSMDSACFDDSAFNAVKFTDCDLTGITGEIAIIDNGSEFRDCDLTDSELRVKSLLIINSHKGIDVLNGTL